LALSAELLSDIPAGSEVQVQSIIKKIGKNVGFCDMVMQCEGKTVARGQHLKYMPMGTLWDVLFHPTLLPIVLSLYSLAKKSWLGGKVLSWLGAGAMSATGISDLKTLSSDSGPAVAAAQIFADFNLDRDAEAEEESKECTPSSGAFCSTVQPQMVNPLGNLHGGALAMCIEEAALQHRVGNGTSAAHTRACAIEVRYLSQIRGWFRYRSSAYPPISVVFFSSPLFFALYCAIYLLY
jgi:hypothetical protein